MTNPDVGHLGEESSNTVHAFCVFRCHNRSGRDSVDSFLQDSNSPPGTRSTNSSTNFKRRRLRIGRVSCKDCLGSVGECT